MPKQKTKRQLAFELLRKSMDSVSAQYINLYFNKMQDIKVKGIILEDSIDVIVDNSIKSYMEKIDRRTVYNNLATEQRQSWDRLSEQIGMAVEEEGQLTLSVIVRGIFGPLVNSGRSTINYNVYKEMYF